MRIFGLDISRRKGISSIDTRQGGWLTVIGEAFSGAWQAVTVQIDQPRDLVAFSGIFSCTTKIANDIAKLYPKLVQDRLDGTCTAVEGNSPYRPVLEKPNHFQTRITFFKQWIASKLIHGNAYVLKERDARGIVRALYVLDPQRVTPLVTDSGDVYYRLNGDTLAQIPDGITVPAREIIHDLMVPLWHPLVGVSPIYACGITATMGNRILRNSTRFFSNMGGASGFLMAPGKLNDEEALKLKAEWDRNYGQNGKNFGGTAVLANGLKFEPAKLIPAQEAQLIEQLKWTIEDVARCYGIPAFKVGGQVPQNTTVGALNQMYYDECLQVLIEDAELCLKEGLGLPADYYVEFDLDGLLRMDPTAVITVEAEAVKAGIKSPDEARLRLNLKPTPGGAGPYLQQQNYSLAALAKRDAKEDPFESATGTAPPKSAPAANDDTVDVAAEAGDLLRKHLEAIA